MLSVLKIKNIAIIESAEIEFSRGFNVLSGETGAGKSIILDSINAVLGFRTSRELIRTGETEAQVTALFSSVGENVVSKLQELDLPVNEDETLLVSRVIMADKNICRVNNALTTVAVLKELGAELMSIHGQQDNRELLNNETHILYLDAMTDCRELMTEYKEKFSALIALRNRIKSLSGDIEEKTRRIDALTYQIDEIEKAEITPGEWASLKDRRSQLQNYEKIQGGIYGAYQALQGGDSFSGAVQLLADASKELGGISQYSSELEELFKRVENLYYEVSDAADSVRDNFNEDGFSQAELEEVENRINLIYKLSKKYGSTEEEILAYLENAKVELENISVSDEQISNLKEKFKLMKDETFALAQKLSDERKKTAISFSKKVCEELRFLDMPQIQFVVDFKETPLTENGIDEVEFLISANVGETPKPLTKIASGGELSRIMLAFKTIMAHKDKVETMIFDEIDSGVSGRAALKVGSKLKQVSDGKQVLCVTHLSQLMAYADSHYLIEKAAVDGKTFTSVKLLNMDGRKLEIARIIGGGQVTELQLKNAEEMISSINQKF
ncbi:MAG: DNA repair protein RecN [Clostridia bacterium]|nr:DNA repair protein RecN [Clostridia bacterium]